MPISAPSKRQTELERALDRRSRARSVGSPTVLALKRCARALSAGWNTRLRISAANRDARHDCWPRDSQLAQHVKPRTENGSMTTRHRSNGMKTYAKAAKRKVGHALHEVKAGALRSLKSKKTKAAAKALIATAVSEALRVEKGIERRVLRKKRLRTHAARSR
jgi:hypothetical protein